MVQPNPGAKVVTLDGTELVDILGLEWGTCTTEAIAQLAAGNLTGNLALSGNLTVAGTTGLTGNTTTGNVSTTGLIAITGNLTASTTVVATGNVTGGNLTTAGTMNAATGNITGTDTVGNLSTAGTVTATGNVSGGNLTTVGTMNSATGNVTGTIAVGNVTNAGTETIGGTLGVTGLATFTLMTRLPESNIAAAGTVLGNATQSVAGFVTVSGADGTVGVKLPATPATGTWIVIKNNGGAALKVYPDAAATINAIAANGPISMAANTSALLFSDSTTQWWTLPLLPS